MNKNIEDFKEYRNYCKKNNLKESSPDSLNKFITTSKLNKKEEDKIFFVVSMSVEDKLKVVEDFLYFIAKNDLFNSDLYAYMQYKKYLLSEGKK